MDLKLIKNVVNHFKYSLNESGYLLIRNTEKAFSLCVLAFNIKTIRQLNGLVTTILYLILICTSFQSCTFSPNGVFENPTSEDIVPPEIQVLKLNLSADTLYLYYSKQVVFHFASNNQKQEVERAHFFIDGIFNVDVFAKNGEFKLEWGNIPEGNHTLKLDLYANSGTNSIADKVGAEFFLFSKTWNVVVDKSYYTQIKSKAVNGYLNIEWPKYKNSDFVEYVVYRGFDYYSKREIGRVKNCEFTDSSYVGESARYFVEVVIRGEDQLTWGALELNYEVPIPSLNLIDNNKTALVWNKSKYYSAIERALSHKLCK